MTDGVTLAATSAVPYLRKAVDFTVETPFQPGQAHRSAAGRTIDYRLQEITGGLARGFSTVPDNFVDKPGFGSPWHYHDCELQIAIVLEGTIELGYRGGTYARASKGDILFIPGAVLHDVSAPSADYQVAELTFPGSFGTTEAEMPAHDIETSGVTLGTGDAVREGVENGIIAYRYPVGGGLADRFAIRRMLRSRVDTFTPCSSREESLWRFTMVTEGWRTIDLGDGDVRQAGVGDLLAVPRGASCRDIDYAADYAGIEVRMLG